MNPVKKKILKKSLTSLLKYKIDCVRFRHEDTKKKEVKKLRIQEGEKVRN